MAILLFFSLGLLHATTAVRIKLDLWNASKLVNASKTAHASGKSVAKVATSHVHVPTLDEALNHVAGTHYHSKALSNGKCGVFAGTERAAVVSGPHQAFFFATSDGTGVGTSGKDCSVSMIERWAEWQHGTCTPPKAWASVWQGTTSVAALNHSISSVSAKVRVPDIPTSKGVEHTYSLWMLGVQPQTVPNLHKKKTWCELQGDDNSMMHNSGQFAKVMYRSKVSDAPGFDDVLFNQGEAWDGRYIFASSVALGKSALRPTFGYGGLAEPGQVVWSEAKLGRLHKELKQAQQLGWQQSLGVQDTDAQIMFSYDSSVLEQVFLKKAVEQGIIKENSEQAALAMENSWARSAGPVYEQIEVSPEGVPPPLEEIPLLWPSEPVHYTDVELTVEGGAGWESHGLENGTVAPWLLQFSEGLQVTGAAFGGRFFGSYQGLRDYMEELVAAKKKPTDYRQLVCLFKCIKSRYEGSHCKKQAHGTAHDCVVQWGKSFPPLECSNAFWNV